MKKLLIISLLVLISSCSVFRKVNRDKTDRKATEQIIKSVVRKGDTVTYVVPKMIMKDTTIYTYNRVGTRIETRFDSDGRIDDIKCIEAALNEFTIINRQLVEQINKKETEKEVDTNINWTWILIAIGVFAFLYLDKRF